MLLKVFGSITLFLSLFFAWEAFSEIRETKAMHEVVEATEPGTLLVFDLDNTIVKPAQSLGGEESYDYFFEKYKQDYQHAGLNGE